MNSPRFIFANPAGREISPRIPGENGADERQTAACTLKAAERHDQLRRQRQYDILDGHEQADAPITERTDEPND
jgi:hypothetical protein